MKRTLVAAEPVSAYDAKTHLPKLLERAAQAQLRAMAATGGRLQGVSEALADKTYRQWVGDGSEWDGDVEWPALLRRLDRLSPGYRD